jgi:hypothetical protein
VLSLILWITCPREKFVSGIIAVKACQEFGFSVQAGHLDFPSDLRKESSPLTMLRATLVREAVQIDGYTPQPEP